MSTYKFLSFFFLFPPFDCYIEVYIGHGSENQAVISGLLLYQGLLYQGFLTLKKPKKFWDLKMLSVISGKPLYPLPLGRGSTVFIKT